MSKVTIPADAAPAPLGHLGIGPPREPTIDGEATASAWLARHGVRSVKWRIFGVARIAELLTEGFVK